MGGNSDEGDYILEVDDKDMTIALYYNDKYNANF